MTDKRGAKDLGKAEKKRSKKGRGTFTNKEQMNDKIPKSLQEAGRREVRVAACDARAAEVVWTSEAR